MKESRIKRNIEGVILGILLLIPCFSVLGRVLYTQWNQNAKDSYFANTINQYEDTYLTENSNVNSSTKYYVNTDNVITHDGDSFSLYVTDLSVVSHTGLTDEQLDILNNYNVYRLVFGYYSSGGFPQFSCYYFDEDNVSHWAFAVRIADSHSSTKHFTLSFFITDLYSGFLMSTFKSTLFTRVYTPNTFLDNAFDTSLFLIVDKYGSGNINFLNWFGNLMFTNPSTLLYCQFANLYLNYCLYINVGYLIYYFFTFFIKMIRRLLDSFIDRRF